MQFLVFTAISIWTGHLSYSAEFGNEECGWSRNVEEQEWDVPSKKNNGGQGKGNDGEMKKRKVTFNN